ncbi:unnamed protein product [Auanema sp. JU1783]|nr:unnamed protein product [Auanema sp. JU1783]
MLSLDFIRLQDSWDGLRNRDFCEACKKEKRKCLFYLNNMAYVDLKFCVTCQGVCTDSTYSHRRDMDRALMDHWLKARDNIGEDGKANVGQATGQTLSSNDKNGNMT